MAAWLAAGRDSAIVSHESAFDLLELSNVLPDQAHIHVWDHLAQRWVVPGAGA